MTPIYAARLDLTTQKIVIGAKKIDGSSFVTDGMVLADFTVQDKLEKICFFEEIFLFADTSIEVVLGIFFLTL